MSSVSANGDTAAGNYDGEMGTREPLDDGAVDACRLRVAGTGP